MRQAFPSLLVTAALLLSSASLVGCGRPYEPATPSGFVDLGEDRYDQDTHEYRASTADGVVLGVRAYDNDPEVDLTLVARALENRLRLGQGYALLEKKEVTARDGTKGVQLRFGHDEGSGPHLYLVTVFITDDRVFVLEAGGKRELFEKAQASIDWSVKNFLPD
jgi:hypothetical protein